MTASSSSIMLDRLHFQVCKADGTQVPARPPVMSENMDRCLLLEKAHPWYYYHAFTRSRVITVSLITLFGNPNLYLGPFIQGFDLFIFRCLSFLSLTYLLPHHVF